MTFPNIIEDINDLESKTNELEERKVNLSDLVNLIYPVGSIYMSTNNVSPATFLGGTWTQIKDTFLLCSGDTYSAGSTGGEANHTLTVAETPAHTHTRGTMNITGYTKSDAGWHGTNTDSSTGAFYRTYSTSNYTGGQYSQQVSKAFNFDASRSWTGATSSVGGSQSHNNMPPYLTVYCWKRTA